jgi:hypothetical protein
LKTHRRNYGLCAGRTPAEVSFAELELGYLRADGLLVVASCPGVDSHGSGQVNLECCSFPVLAIEPDIAAKLLHDLRTIQILLGH